MNIKLYMHVRDNVHDVGRMATAALLAVCARCPKNQDQVAVSVALIANDLRCHWETATRALHDAQKAGYLAVEKPANKWSPTVWQVLVAVSARTQDPRTLVAESTINARAGSANKGLKDWRKEGGDAAQARPGASAAAVDKQPPRSQSFAERQADEERRQAERDAAVARLVAPTVKPEPRRIAETGADLIDGLSQMAGARHKVTENGQSPPEVARAQLKVVEEIDEPF